MSIFIHKKLLPAVTVAIMIAAAMLAGCQAPVVPAGTQPQATGTAAPGPAQPATSAATASPAATAAAEAKAAPAAGSYCVTLDVNPSIELAVENGIVTKVTAYNDDAQKIVLNVDVSGLTADEAVKKLVKALADGGYINNDEVKPYLLISVIDPKQTGAGLGESLKETMENALESLKLNCDVETTSIPADIAAKAEALGISAGRYLIFEYIAKKEGITVEQAVAKYGTLKVAELMRLYEDMDEALGHPGDKDCDEDDGQAPSLTSDRQAVLDAALVKYKDAVKTAEEAYLKAKTEAIAGLKAQWEALIEKYKGAPDSAEFKQAKKALKASYRALRSQMHETFKLAIDKAQDGFRAAVASLGLTDEQIDRLLDYHVNGGCKDDSDKYMRGEPDDEPKGSDKADENKDADGKQMDQDNHQSDSDEDKDAVDDRDEDDDHDGDNSGGYEDDDHHGGKTGDDSRDGGESDHDGRD